MVSGDGKTTKLLARKMQLLRCKEQVGRSRSVRDKYNMTNSRTYD
jgi:hypothetical protein